MKKPIKILVLGSSGLIGHQVYYHFSKNKKYKLYDISLKRKVNPNTILFDLTNFNELEKIIKKIKPKYIINCCGVLINASNKDPESAILLNSYLPNYLSKIADNLESKLIHISTDCVFSGDKGKYREDDIKDGTSIYSKTKSLGEINTNNHLTIRTSVVGPELKLESEELLNWFLSQKNKIYGYKKSLWSGVTTIYLAQLIEELINKKISGIYQVTTNKSISKYELLVLFNKYSNQNIKIIPINGIVTNKTLVDTRKLIKLKIPSYNIMIKELFDFISNNKIKYNHYYLNNKNIC
jgi:dTDP-4-dehydrorhamnose reductase